MNIYYVLHIVVINSFNCHNHPMRWVAVTTILWIKNSGTKNLCYLPKVTQLVMVSEFKSKHVVLNSQAISCQALLLPWHIIDNK